MNFLTRKFGPLPAWGWAGVVVAGYLGYRWWTGRAGTAATTAAGTTGLSGGGSGSAGAPSPTPAPTKGGTKKPKKPPPIKHPKNPGPPVRKPAVAASTQVKAWNPVPKVATVTHPVRKAPPKPPPVEYGHRRVM